MTGLIRVAEPQDLLALEKIENDADELFIDRFQPDKWWTASTGEERAATLGFILVMAEDDEVVGFVHVVENAGVAHLEQLSVSPSRARRGYGRALVEAAKFGGARRGYREMTVRTYEDVPWNAPFYAKLGFQVSEPATEFHQQLVELEERLKLDQYGRRIQMTAPLRA